MSRELPFADKNGERKLLASRCRQIKDFLAGKIFSNTVSLNSFFFIDGECRVENMYDGNWEPFDENSHWGYREQYCRFRQTVKIPESFKGKRVAYSVTPFPDGEWDSAAQQFMFFVNGKLVQAGDSNHQFIFLTDSANGNEEFDIVLYAYCDDWLFSGETKLSASLKAYNSDVAALYYDIDSLLDAIKPYSPDDASRIKIIKALNEAVNLLELCTPDENEFISSVNAAREYLDKNIFGEKNDAFLSAIGHTHIDVAYKWRVKQTRDKAGRSFATVLNLMNEYPDYKFMSSQPQLYEFVKRDYPEIFAGIKEKVKEKRWEPEGSLWVESDTNVVSGESLVRQFMFGKRFFKNEFGVDNKILWLPDVFGYSAALPQIMKLAGTDYFMTTKISWNEYNRFPYDTFMWEGIDGTKVLSHFAPCTDEDDSNDFNTTYNVELSPDVAVYSWKRYSNKNLNNNILCTVGHGDGGGGASRIMLEKAQRLQKGIPGCPYVKQEFAGDFFNRLNNDVSGNKYLPKWRGELYLEFHRGTLTSQARNKKFNRKGEFLLHDTELLYSAASLLKEEDYPAQKINELWKVMLINQFHDIIPGSAVTPAFEDSKKEYEKLFEDANALKSSVLDVIASDKNDGYLTVFNTFSQDRTDIVITDAFGTEDITVFDGGTPLPTQHTFDGRLIFLATSVPANGFKVFTVKKTVCDVFGDVDADTLSAENSFYYLQFDDNMNISSLYFKECEREVANGQVLNRLTAFEDRPHQYEAWDLKCYYDEKSWEIDNVSSAKVVEKGPVRTVIEVIRSFYSSSIKQYFVFYDHTSRIDVMYDIDWKEKNIAIKADYPVDVNTDRATFDIQFGQIERTTSNNTLSDYARFEVCGHKWADLSDNSFGLSVLNDCKYGWNVKDGHIRPTLLRSATKPNFKQDRERHTFTYAILPHSGNINTSDTVFESYCLNIPLTAVPGKPQDKTEFSLASTDKNNVIIETVKKAEDSNALIFRLYENGNSRTKTVLTFAKAIKKAFVCNLLEENDTKTEFCGNTVPLTFRPFEIKTVKIFF